MIRAELHKSNQATAAGITVRSASPVLALCRKLVAMGFNPSEPLEAYRGATMCLRVRSIGEGARLRIAGNGVGFEWDRAAGASDEDEGTETAQAAE
jgi:hypothetical protein